MSKKLREKYKDFDRNKTRVRGDFQIFKREVMQLTGMSIKKAMAYGKACGFPVTNHNSWDLWEAILHLAIHQGDRSKEYIEIDGKKYDLDELNIKGTQRVYTPPTPKVKPPKRPTRPPYFVHHPYIPSPDEDFWE